jgi:hypothetical protein
LLYVLELGATEQSIAKQAIRSGEPLPDRIANAPKLRLGLQLYFNAFFDLDSERAQGFTIGRIPWIAICRYAEFYGFDEEQSQALLYFIKAMDTVHLKRIEGKTKA